MFNTKTSEIIKINEYLGNPLKEYNLKENIINLTNQPLHKGAINNIYFNLPYYHIFQINENYCDYIRKSKEYELDKLYNTLVNNLAIILGTKDLSQILVGEYYITTKFDKNQLPPNYKNIILELDNIFLTKLHEDLRNVLINNTDFIVQILSEASLENNLKKYISEYKLDIYFLNHINLLDDEIFVDTFEVSRKLDKKIFIEKTELTNKLNEYTFGLLKHIPFQNNNLIYSGGSLYDAITNSNNINNYVDIDIFALSGSDKMETLKYILNSLINDKHNCYVTATGDVYYIFVENVPRLIQIIFTNYNSPQEIINNFDSSYVKSYYNGTTVFSSLLCVNGLMQNSSYYYPNKLLRTFKILHRGLKIIQTDKKPNMKFFGNYYDNNATSKKDLVINTDYDSLLTDQHVINYLTKLKFKDIQNIDELCRIYNFKKDKFIYVAKLLNDSIIDVIIKTNQFDDNKKNTCKIVKRVIGYNGSFKPCQELILRDKDIEKMSAYYKKLFGTVPTLNLTPNYNINLYGKLLHIVDFGFNIPTGYILLLVKINDDSAKVHNNMNRIADRFTKYDLENKVFQVKKGNLVYRNANDYHKSFNYTEYADKYLKEGEKKSHYVYKIKFNNKTSKINKTKIGEMILIRCNMYIISSPSFEYKLKEISYGNTSC